MEDVRRLRHNQTAHPVSEVCSQLGRKAHADLLQLILEVTVALLVQKLGGVVDGGFDVELRQTRLELTPECGVDAEILSYHPIDAAICDGEIPREIRHACGHAVMLVEPITDDV